MTPEAGALARVVRVLERLSIRYMLTGSVASSYHGRPRTTHDADIVIDPAPADLESLVADLAADGFFLSAERARDALRRRLQFNVVDTDSGAKIDLIIRKERAFSHEELDRRRSAEIGLGFPVSLASPEDALLSKLEWSIKAGGSERQIEDAVGIFRVNPGLDRSYIERWAVELGVVDLWRQIADGEVES